MLEKPDLTMGISPDAIPDGGKVVGVVGEEDVLLVRRGQHFFAIGAFCTHYHGPLADGLIVENQVRCPWHHACFDLNTGEALRAPALDAVSCWNVVTENDKVFVRAKKSPVADRSATKQLSSIILVGGGAAGLAAAEMLRRKGYSGSLRIISADSAAPCDRPNLSKDFLAGNAPDEWIPLRPAEWYAEQNIELMLGVRVTELDTKAKTVRAQTGQTYEYDALLLATGAEPRQIAVEGADPSRVFYLRSFSDSKEIVRMAGSSSRVVVVGASFIGLEVAASLRARGLTVDVVAPGSVPMEKVIGSELGRFVQNLHEAHGVRFHLDRTVKRMDGMRITLSDGTKLEADFLVLGVGVSPSLDLAQRAGLAVDQGILVNEYLETSAPGVYAAGDAARWPDPHSGERIRVEHWVVAERQGQTAAKNMIGIRERFDAVPFFWSQHYDLSINYVGHAGKWDAIAVNGDPKQGDCSAAFTVAGKKAALVTIGRDLESLRAEVQMEAGSNDQPA
jgi:NADPH-dependent 2,4-dienoyl-CoA reductase/sulfur reductase-like enzyme/nitrite reductase/ring-hydroxylating ferredoxin subunit